MSGIPIRLRLTGLFVLVMATVLAATGLLLYERTSNALRSSIDAGLGARLDDLAENVRDGRLEQQAEEGGATEASSGFTQVLRPDGSLYDSAPGSGSEPVLDPAAAGAIGAAESPFEIDLDGEPLRLLAERIETSEGPLVPIAGVSRRQDLESLSSLRSQLLIGGPLALLLTSIAGYGLAAAALRPVEAMREGAAEISAARSGDRLPVPPARDELSRLGETLNAMLERLDAALIRERHFVADSSHELRTPLAQLRTAIDVALRRPRTNAEYVSTLNAAGADVDRLQRIADDLLLLARVDEGLLPIRRERIPLEPILSGVERRFADRAKDLGRSIEIELGSASPVASLDPLRIDQALTNLLDNALRHGRGTVRVEAEGRGELLILGVSDEGDGFAADFINHAFERFTRAQGAPSADGAGLGLSIVEAIALAHCGLAAAENLPGGGARVRLEIPQVG